uniref:cadmium-induced protein AS8 n=1 Tax=Erigeron canadensis TaxID=72917 RepID=UPI001CB8C6FF|nr:cadmium-induced protein AS8 [Erigeron canadensis]
MVVMIIKGLFRRYKKWNPVHPTSGAFWGMGIGFGCGVGWGPGFGPEVIGYVGAGCGVGFSVGITLAGVGIGLPANRLLKVPFSAFMATRSGAMDLARSSGLLGTSIVNGGVDVSGLERWVSNFNHEQSVDKSLHFSGINKLVSSPAKMVIDCFDQLKSRINPPH